MLRRRAVFVLAASAVFPAAIVSACGGKVTPEKDATLTFGCYVGECVPAAQDASEDADDFTVVLDADTEIDAALASSDASDASDTAESGDSGADADAD